MVVLHKPTRLYHHFRFYVEKVEDPVAHAVAVASQILKTNPKHGVHIIVNSKRNADVIFGLLSKKYEARLVTADTSDEDQSLAAEQWGGGSVPLLVSTTVALVGNENSACRHVMVVGYLFNLINLVQAVGRLRPKQREGRKPSTTIQPGGDIPTTRSILVLREFGGDPK